MNVKELYAKANKQFAAKKYDAALKTLDEIKRRKPDYKDAYYLEAWIYRERNNFVREYSALKNLLQLSDLSSPEETDFAVKILAHIGSACANLALLAEAKEIYSLMLKIADPLKAERLSSIIFLGNAPEDSSPEYFRPLYSEYKKHFIGITPYTKKFYEHKRIRIGFLSADFCMHTVINWSLILLTKLDKNLFATYFYSNGKVKDNVTKLLRSTADAWRDISGLTDEAAAKLIHDDEIDLLFDLSGHTVGNRLCVAAYRPASVQMSGIGYMNSTGLDCFDYFLSDETCAGDEAYFTEKLIKLPHSHFCYSPSTKLEPADSPPCMRNGFVTFGCFNKFYKITDSILIAWKKILDAVPNSRLLLKAKIFDSEEGKLFAAERLQRFGFDLARVDMRPFTARYLVEYGDADIALDTFPYTGGVTTCEALYMGVPVVSLYGDRHGSRFGLSILKNIGLNELAADSYDGYVNRAIALANDWDLLALLRKNLRVMMRNSPLMDSASYLREVEEVFIKILNDEKNASNKS